MDKTAIKNFAVWARRKLIEDIKQKAYEIGITEKEIKEPQVVTTDTMIIGDRTLSKAEMKQRQSLVSRVKEKGFNNVVDEVAYTWFNRFIAIRFMEVNEYLPTGVRVLSSHELGKKEPEIIKEALNTDLNLDKELVYKLQDVNDTETLFRYLFVKQCNALNKILPGLFEEIEDYTEILLPSNLLSEGSVIRQLVDGISEDDFKDQVEIIGWVYQYYISEKKGEVFEGLKKNIKLTKENIPAATQLFTPDWIVKYMVENSLGRVWLDGHFDKDLKQNWKYYLEEVSQETDVANRLKEVREKSKELKPEDIKVIDPAMGSGHILVYAFDVLYEIYKNNGYSERDIARLIIENNLYGLDIDERAAQIAYFAIMMKARSKNRRIFSDKVSLNVCAIQESNNISNELINFVANGNNMIKEDLRYIINTFLDAKEYGSILDVNPVNFGGIYSRIFEIQSEDYRDLFDIFYKSETINKILPVVRQAEIMSLRYDVVLTNPPYMRNRSMNGKLTAYIQKYYSDNKSDLYSVFIDKCFMMAKTGCYVGMITQHSWMFLSSFEKLREKLSNRTIINMVHLGPRAFEEISGEVVQTTTFVYKNINVNNYCSTFIRLVDYNDAQLKQQKFIEMKDVYISKNESFNEVPGSPIVYWASNAVLESFKKGIPLGDISYPRKGNSTSNNDRFLRLWYEVPINEINIGAKEIIREETLVRRWFPYNKGGRYRKWYGNNEYVVDWFDDAKEMRSIPTAVIANYQFFMKPGLTWSTISSGNLGVRSFGDGFIFDNKGESLFTETNDYNREYFAGLLNSKVATNILQLISPTLDFNCGYISKVPVILDDSYKPVIHTLVSKNIAIAKNDWDSYEVSWDFPRHPLLTYARENIKCSFENWRNFTEHQFNVLKANEEELNRIFIKIYSIEDELSPEVKDKDITIKKGDREREIKSLISYAVGCMFGRYSIDEDGLIYAGGDFKDSWLYENNKCRVRKIKNDDEGNITFEPWINSTFIPDVDNILPIIDDEYFDDDIVTRLVEFLKVAFSDETSEDNLDYIADTLGRKANETSRQTIRRYFLKDFYKDHIQTYQKRPIYWLFDSGKQDGFKALIYMHRYDEFTVAKLRTDYLHKLQKSYEAEVKRLDIVIDSSASEREKANARKKKEKILKQMEECRQYDQVIAHVANQRIKIDLDDGVSVNYAKFQGIEIPQGDGKKPLKADLLAKI